MREISCAVVTDMQISTVIKNGGLQTKKKIKRRNTRKVSIITINGFFEHMEPVFIVDPTSSGGASNLQFVPTKRKTSEKLEKLYIDTYLYR